MIRSVLIEVALFLAPFAAYAAYVGSRRGDARRGALALRVVAILAGIALALVAASFLLIVHFAGVPPGSTYVPARYRERKFIPGQVEP